MDPLRHYREVWLCDFEFCSAPGERPEPLCMVAREFRTHRTVKLWFDEHKSKYQLPFTIGDDVLFVAYYASAELGCFMLSVGRLQPEFSIFSLSFGSSPMGCRLFGAGLLGASNTSGLVESKPRRKKPCELWHFVVGRTLTPKKLH